MKVILKFEEISDRIRKFKFPDVDIIIGISEGGIVPSCLIAYHLKLPLKLIGINFRDEKNNPKFDSPKLISEFTPVNNIKRILLVDDVSVSGKTIELARSFLQNYHVDTLVFKGKADYVLFPEVDKCVKWPWKIY
ncbi:phosphoribosyltransferase family protein [Bacteroidota bacterium]